jgi:excisionase family DNA binding protein
MEEDLRKVADLITANIISTTKAVLTADEAARYMGISKSTLYKMTMRKQIPHSKPNGKMCYFLRTELEAWLMSNRVATIDELQERAQAYCAHTRTISNKKGGVR